MSIYREFCQIEENERGGPERLTLNYPDTFNFAYDVADAIARRTPEKRAMVWCNAQGEERSFTFGEVRRESDRMAQVFRAAGLRRGMRVMLVLKRHYEYWFAVLALHKLGVTAMPVTHMLTVKDYEYRIRTARPEGIVCTPGDQVPERLREAADRVGSGCILWTVRQSVPGFRNLTEEAAAAPDGWERVPTLVTDPMLLYFTSGTTGDPKGVFHDFAYPLAHIITARYWQQAEEDGLHFTVAETGWAKASWGKIYGQWLVGSAVMIFDFDNFDPKQLCTVINRFGVTSFCAPPTVYRCLVRKDIPPMPGLRHVSTAGEKLAPEVFRRFEEKTGLRLSEGYGQTETTLLMGNLRGSDSVAGSMGTLSPFYRIALRSRDGREVPVGEIGEVVVLPGENGRQEGIFSGYLGGEEQYRHAWRGGVYHTGDAAWQDDTGHFWFHGRFDDIIKTGGYRVGPYEVEHVLMEHPAVTDCSVVGVPDALRGQSIKAFVVLKEGYDPSRDLELAIRNQCNEHLAEYKWIRSIAFVNEMPTTISGKTRRAELRTAT